MRPVRLFPHVPRPRAHGGRRRLKAAALLVGGLAVGGLAPAQAEVTGGISGVVFADANRDGVMQAGEAAYDGHRVYLYDGTGTYLAYTVTDSTGRYAFGGLAAGTYRVEYAPQTWWAIRDALVPTTTGSVRPTHLVSLNGSAKADFGWRPIVVSTDLGAPLSETVMGTGSRVYSYTDAVAASEVAAALAQGRLLGDEAPRTTVYFGYSGSSTCSTGVARVDGAYSDFNAWCYVAYESWLDDGDRTLFHEYGHAWGLYHAYLAQQDPQLATYLEARGLVGDARLDTSHAWNRHELLAEDYRHLFGSPTARQGGQMNRDIPLASEVAGLEDFLATTFRTASSGPSPEPDPAPAPAPAVPTAVHVADLDGQAGTMAKGTWAGHMTVALRDDLGGAVDGARVTISWAGGRGESGTTSCTTEATGSCRVSATVMKTTASVRFAVVDAAASGLAYVSGDNADPDGDSDGTTLVVARPA